MKSFGTTGVAVVGGGTSGVVAAIASARAGAETLLIEQSAGLGGTSTRGFMNCFVTFHDALGRQAIRGIAQEIVDRLVAAGGSQGHTRDTMGECLTRVLFEPVILEQVLFEMVAEAGIEVLFNTVVVDVLTAGEMVKGLIICNKGGVQSVLCAACVDSSGDGDVAVAAGAQYEQAAPSELQPITLMFRLGGVDVAKWADLARERPEAFELTRVPDDVFAEGLGITSLTFYEPFRDAVDDGVLPAGIAGEQVWLLSSADEAKAGVVTVNGTRIAGVDGTNPRHLSRAAMEGRRQAAALTAWLRGNVQGFERSFIHAFAQQLGVRETRRIIGDRTITEEDVLAGARFPDAVAKGATPIDIHGGDADSGENFWIKTDDRGIRAYDIPYGSLIPRGVGNIVVAGRCISATHQAHGATRMQPVAMATGQAAGVIAALCARDAVGTRELDIGVVREVLVAQDQVIDDDQLVVTAVAEEN